MSRLTNQMTVTVAGLRGPVGTVGTDLAALEANVIEKAGVADAAALAAVQLRDQAAESESGAQAAYENTLIASAGLVLPNYDPRFSPFLDGAIDSAGVVVDTAVDYRGAPYEPPLISWARPRNPGSANYEAWVDAGLIMLRSNTTKIVQARTTSPAHIRNVSISPDETAIFFEQYVALRGWQQMYIPVAGSAIALPRNSLRGVLGIGDSMTNGAMADKFTTAKIPSAPSGILGGWLTIAWLDPEYRAAGIDVRGLAWSGAPSGSIADNIVALPDTDYRLQYVICANIGRNGSATPLDDLKRIVDKATPYSPRITGWDIPYRRSSNKIGMAARDLIDENNALMKAFLGPENWGDTNAHITDPGPNGALAVAIARGDLPGVAEPDAQSLQDLADGVTPSLLVGDDVHYNDAGYLAVWDVNKPMLALV